MKHSSWTIRKVCLLILLTAFILVPASVSASDKAVSSAASDKAVSGTDSVIKKTFVNPLYKGLIDEPDPGSAKEISRNGNAEAVFFGDITTGDASEYILEQLLKRERTIKIRFPSLGADDAQVLEDIFTSAFNDYGPGTGDYMRNSIGSWTYEAFPEDDGNGGVITNATYTVDFFTTAEQEKQVDQKLAEIAEELKYDELDDYERVLAAYKYVTSHVTYDYKHLNDDSYDLKYTAYAALFNGTAVCQGYAALFYRLTNDYWLSSRIISGRTGSNEEHAWNIVRLGESYYNVDCTWDAGKLSGRYDYYLKCDANFPDHFRDAEFDADDFRSEYPMAKEDYIVPPDFESGKTYTSGNYSYQLDGAGNALITAYSGKEKSVTVPAKIDGHPVYAIDKGVFGDTCTAETITLSEGIKGWYNNGDSAFTCCPELTTVNLPSTVGFHDGSPYDITAKNNRFHACLKLAKINLAKGNPYLAVVDNVLFTKDMKTLIYYPTGAAAASYTVPNGVTYIDDCSFSDQQHLTSVTFPASLETIGWFSFQYAEKLSSVKIPDGCRDIGQWAFYGTAIETVHIPASVESIVSPAFPNPVLKSITVSKENPYYYIVDGALFSKKTFGDATYITLECYPAKRGGKTFVIPDGTTDIAMNAFDGCTSLEKVTIPISVTSIESNAFQGCYNLKKVDYAGTDEDWNKIDFWGENTRIQNVYNGIIEEPGQEEEDPGEISDPASPGGSDVPSAVDVSDGRAPQTGSDETAVGEKTSAEAVEAAILSMKNNKDLTGSKFSVLQAKSVKQAKTSVTVTWKKVKGAKKYVVYGSKCGKKNRMQKQASTGKNTLVFKKLKGNNGKKAKIKKGTYYRFIVVALDKNKNVISTSKIVFVASKGGKAGNVKKVTTKAKKKKVTLKKGKSFKLAAKAVPVSKKLKVKKLRALAYETSNKKIATVSKKGVIKAKKKGKCYIYAYAQNGVAAKVKVTVR